MSFVLALDQGTTSSRAIVFDERGDAVSVAQKEFRQIFPAHDRVEHDPIEIWETQLTVAREALERSGCDLKQIAAIGITNQRETTVIWDRESGRPIYNAIVWQDRRTAEYCRAVREKGHESLVTASTGLVLDPYFSATKIRWILENVEGARDLAAAGRLAFGTIDTWLIWNLTAGRVHATDVTNASRTMLFNLSNLKWDPQLLELFDVPEPILPEVRSSSELYGHCDKSLFGIALPITGVAGDQQAALFGQLCTKEGMAKNTYGTGCFLLLNTGTRLVRSRNRLISTIAAFRGSTVQYALEGSVFMGGAIIQWLRDGLNLISSSDEVEALAASVPDADGVVLVPAFTGLGAPHWDPDARGTIVGLNRGSNRAHIARAALESIALQSMDVLNAMNADIDEPLRELRVDGGASRNNFLMQFQADVAQVPVIRTASNEATALGAAYLAGLAVGVWSDEDELRQLWKPDRIFEPVSDPVRQRTDWRRAVDRARGWIDHSETNTETNAGTDAETNAGTDA